MSNEKQIIRVEKTNNYSVINNGFLRRKDLSWKAKGILAYILTLPDDWTIYTHELVTHATDGRDSFRKGWTELKKAGYIETKQLKKDGKFSRNETIVHESPINTDATTFLPSTENPSTGKPLTGKPSTENPPLLNTYSTNYLSKLNTDLNNNMADPANAGTVPDLTAEFEILWKLYPKGRKQGKDKAKRVYIRERKKKDGPSFDLVKTKLLEYTKQIQVKHTEPQFIKQGGTWFGQHSWEDEYDLTPSTFKPAFNKGRRVEKLPDYITDPPKDVQQTELSPERQASIDKKMAEYLAKNANSKEI